MKELPLRKHALNVERINVDGVTKFKYQHSPVFDELVECIRWIKDNLDSLEEIEHAS